MFEPVETVDDYYDGPRAGLAVAFGRRCRYETFAWRAPHGDPDEERYVLTLLDTSEPSSLIATAVFRPLAEQPDLRPGVIRKLEAEWYAVATP
jgi:hypothetical protein